MMTFPYNESEMSFGPYPEEHIFNIDESHKDHKMEQNIMMADFLLIRNEDEKPSIMWVIEAKKSAPSPKNKIRFDEFNDEITEKLVNGLTLGIAMCLLRHEFAK